MDSEKRASEDQGENDEGLFLQQKFRRLHNPLRGLEKMLGNIEWTSAEGRKTREVRELLKELEAE